MSAQIPLETFSSLLRFHRERRHLTQRALADQAGYDRSYLSYLERGLRNPTREVVLRLAEVLELAATERDQLLVSARFAGEGSDAGELIDLSDQVVALVARSINGLREPQRSSFRSELASFLRYLRVRYELANDAEVRTDTTQDRDALGQRHGGE